jgi:hypothetical protein
MLYVLQVPQISQSSNPGDIVTMVCLSVLHEQYQRLEFNMGERRQCQELVLYSRSILSCASVLCSLTLY